MDAGVEDDIRACANLEPDDWLRQRLGTAGERAVEQCAAGQTPGPPDNTLRSRCFNR